MPDLSIEKLDQLVALADRATPGRRESVYTTYRCYIAVNGRPILTVADWHLAPGFVPPLHVDAEYEASCDPDTIRSLVAMARRANPDVITPKQFAERMRELISGDEEAQHGSGDTLMEQVLTQLGYGEGVEVFQNMDKWYA